MKISVDTSHDSHDEIRKVIAMLQHLVGDQHIATNAQEDELEEEQPQMSSSPEISSGFSAMFGSDTQSQPQTVEPVENEAVTVTADEPEMVENISADDLISQADDEPEAQEEPTTNDDALSDIFSQQSSESDDDDEDQGPGPQIKLY